MYPRAWLHEYTPFSTRRRGIWSGLGLELNHLRSWLGRGTWKPCHSRTCVSLCSHPNRFMSRWCMNWCQYFSDPTFVLNILTTFDNQKQCFRIVWKQKDGQLKLTGLSGIANQFGALDSSMQHVLYRNDDFLYFKSKYRKHQKKTSLFPQTYCVAAFYIFFRLTCDIQVFLFSSKIFSTKI